VPGRANRASALIPARSLASGAQDRILPRVDQFRNAGACRGRYPREVTAGLTKVVLTWLVLLAVAGGPANAAPGAWPKVVHLTDGSSVSVWQNGRVVERDSGGQLTADSYCRSYTRYQRWVKFMSSFRAAVLTNDRTAIAARITYPLLWNHGSPWHSTSIPSLARFVSDYSTIFRPSVVASIKAADPRALFCHLKTMVMLGSGVVWGDDRSGRLTLISINGASA
jgi:hypothetical protein